MTPSLLLLALLASVPSKKTEFEMPPPPPGMRPLDEAAKEKLLEARSESDADEDAAPEDSEQIQEESAELEALRAIEDSIIDPVAAPDAQLLQSLRRLGVANPLRQRMLDSFDDPVLREDVLPPPLPRIHNLARIDMSQFEGRYDIPIDMRPLVAEYIRFFQGPGRRWFRNWMNRSTRYVPMMQEILAQHGLPRDTVYLAMIESGFSAHAYSWAHAAGPWQFISATGKHFGLEQNFWVDERRDPIKATHAAAEYLKELHGQLGHWYLAWAGYNTGVGRVRRLVKKHQTTDFWFIAQQPRGLMQETKHYVPKLIAAALIAKNPAAFGFRDEEFRFEEPFVFEEVKLTDPTDLEVIARAAGVKEKALRALNPELKRWCTPPATAKEPYLLRLPVGTREKFLAEFKRIPKKQRLTYRVHRVKSGDTLARIAQRYNSSAEAILLLNKLRSTRSLRVNAELVVPVPARGQSALRGDPMEKQIRSANAPAGSASASAKKVAGRNEPTSAVRTQQIDGRTRITYEVMPGDTLWSLAERFNVTIDELRNWNRILDRKRSLKAGTMLFVWTSTRASVETRSGTVLARKGEGVSRGSAARRTHRLSDGETLWSVSRRYNVSVDELKRWNEIGDHRAVRVGQELVIHAP